MAERHADEHIQETRTSMKRRGLLAGAAALVAGIAAKQTAQPVLALGVVLGNGFNDTTYNVEAQSTTISGNVYLYPVLWGWNTGSGDGIGGSADSGTGVAGYGTYGVFGQGSFEGVTGNIPSSSSSTSTRAIRADNSGTGTNNIGLGATVSGPNGFGVAAAASGGGNSFGVHGSTTGDAVNASGVKGVASVGVTNGVWGENTSTAGNATGVFGLASTAATAGPTVGVWGRSQSTSAGSIGVYGEAAAQAAFGVQGRATGAGGFGVYGTSAGGPGVFGTTTAAQNAGLAGLVSTPGTAAFAGTSTNPNAFAGFFTGDVLVNGNFTVIDPTKKHGAIAHPDGSHRILYSMESPESWLEDFGKGQLVGGKAIVTLDPDFAAITQTEDYHVFLTTYGVSQGLDVTAQSATGFVVQERNNGTSAIRFGYRVVAKPRSENKATRMAKFVIPEIKVPDMAGPIQTVPSKPSTGSAGPPDLAPSPHGQSPSRPVPPAASPPTAPPPQGRGTTPGTTPSPVQPAPPPRP